MKRMQWAGVEVNGAGGPVPWPKLAFTTESMTQRRMVCTLTFRPHWSGRGEAGAAMLLLLFCLTTIRQCNLAALKTHLGELMGIDNVVMPAMKTSEIHKACIADRASPQPTSAGGATHPPPAMRAPRCPLAPPPPRGGCRSQHARSTPPSALDLPPSSSLGHPQAGFSLASAPARRWPKCATVRFSPSSRLTAGLYPKSRLAAATLNLRFTDATLILCQGGVGGGSAGEGVGAVAVGKACWVVHRRCLANRHAQWPCVARMHARPPTRVPACGACRLGSCAGPT